LKTYSAFRPEPHVALNKVICVEIANITQNEHGFCLFIVRSVISIKLIEMGQQTFHFINLCIFKHAPVTESVFVSVKIGSNEALMLGKMQRELWGTRPRTNIYTARCMAFAINYRKTIKFAINQMESGNCRLM